MFLKIALGIWFGNRKQTVVKTCLGLDSLGGADPMDGALYLAAGGRAAGFAVQIGRAMELYYFAGRVFFDAIALDNVGVFQTDLPSGAKTEIFGRRALH